MLSTVFGDPYGDLYFLARVHHHLSLHITASESGTVPAFVPRG